MFKLIITVSILFSFNKSQAVLISDSTICEEHNIKAANFIAQYSIDGNVSNLDSALFYIEKVYDICPMHQELFVIRKLTILAEKRDYTKAIKFIESLDSVLLNGLPYYPKLLLFRFNAMKAQSESDFEKRNYYLKKIVDDIENFLNKKKSKIKSLLRSKSLSEIYGNKSGLGTSFTQYYYYRSILEGKDNIIKELRKMIDNKRYNKEFIEQLILDLDDDFMMFYGL